MAVTDLAILVGHPDEQRGRAAHLDGDLGDVVVDIGKLYLYLCFCRCSLILHPSEGSGDICCMHDGCN